MFLAAEVEKKLDPRPACSLESKAGLDSKPSSLAMPQDACKPEDRVILEESEKMSKAERAAKIKEVQQEIQDTLALFHFFNLTPAEHIFPILVQGYHHYVVQYRGLYPSQG